MRRIGFLAATKELAVVCTSAGMFLATTGIADVVGQALVQPVTQWVKLVPQPDATSLSDESPAMMIGDG